MAEDTSSQSIQSTPLASPVSLKKKIFISLIQFITFTVLFTVTIYLCVMFMYESYDLVFSARLLPDIFEIVALSILWIVPSIFLLLVIYSVKRWSQAFRKHLWRANIGTIAAGLLLIGGYYAFLPMPIPSCWHEDVNYFRRGIFIYNWSIDIKSSKKLPEAYMWNFRCRPDDDTYDAETDNYIYIWGDILPWADASSFYHIPDTNYARDLNHVFSYGTIVPEAHYSTFKPMVTMWGTLKDVAKDDKNVYMWSTITGKNPKTFRYIWWRLAWEGLFARNWYWIWSEIRDHSEYYYFKDDKNVYFWWQLKTIEWADPQSFTLIRQPRTSGIQQLAQDKNYFYVYSEKIPDIDPIRWKYVWWDFFASRSSVYNYKTKSVVEWADLRTFRCETDEVYGSVKCWDKNYYYYTLQKCDVKDCTYKIGKTKIFTLDEVKLHSSLWDCLSEIWGEVYDITKYYAESWYSWPTWCNQELIYKIFIGYWNPDTRWNLETREKYKIWEIAKN